MLNAKNYEILISNLKREKKPSPKEISWLTGLLEQILYRNDSTEKFTDDTKWIKQFNSISHLPSIPSDIKSHRDLGKIVRLLDAYTGIYRFVAYPYDNELNARALTSERLSRIVSSMKTLGFVKISTLSWRNNFTSPAYTDTDRQDDKSADGGNFTVWTYNGLTFELKSPEDIGFTPHWFKVEFEPNMRKLSADYPIKINADSGATYQITNIDARSIYIQLLKTILSDANAKRLNRLASLGIRNLARKAFDDTKQSVTKPFKAINYNA